MDKDKAKNIKPDNPLSITDGAPRTVDVCGSKARLPAAMDYRIAAKVSEACTLDETDQAVIMLYTCLHTTKTQIGKLWTAARNPRKLWDEVGVWQAGVPVDRLSDAINELMSYDDELAEEGDDDDAENLGKKKTGVQ